MKKILGLFIAFVLGVQLSANAATDWTNKANVARVNNIGKALLAKIICLQKLNLK